VRPFISEVRQRAFEVNLVYFCGELARLFGKRRGYESEFYPCSGDGGFSFSLNQIKRSDYICWAIFNKFVRFFSKTC